MAEPSDTELLRRAAAGDPAGWELLLARYRDRLRRMVALRLDPRLRGRVDPSDVIQEACLEAFTRLADYLSRRTMPFFLWLRYLTGQKLMILHRRHLQAECRDAGREVTLSHVGLPPTSSAALAAQLPGREPSPSEAAIRAEMKRRLREALARMDPLDREILSLRHFEQLNNRETAESLGIGESAASKRYVRALSRLRDSLAGSSGDPAAPPI